MEMPKFTAFVAEESKKELPTKVDATAEMAIKCAGADIKNSEADVLIEALTNPTERNETPPRARIRLVAPCRYVTLSVTDNRGEVASTAPATVHDVVSDINTASLVTGSEPSATTT